MTAADFDTHFNRLTAHFHLPADSDRGLVGLEWFKAVEHYHVDALDRGVTDLIRGATERYWPPLGKLLELIRGRLAGMEKTRNVCATCDGSGWIEAWPVMSFGMVYEMNSRCPDCGIPAPAVPVHPRSRPLTKVEYADWKARRAHRDTMPEWAKAKNPTNLEAREDLRKWVNETRERLFGPLKKDGAA